MKIIGIFLVTILNIYYWLMFIRLLIPLFKLPRLPLITYLFKITDPVLNFFKKIITIRYNNIDFSPLLILFLLFFLQIPIRDLMIRQVHFTPWYILGLSILAIDIIISSLAFTFFIAGIILLIINIYNIYTDQPLIYLFKNLFNIIINFVSKIIKIKNNNYAYRIYLVISLSLIAIIGIIIHSILTNLYLLTFKIPANELLYKQIMESKIDTGSIKLFC